MSEKLTTERGWRGILEVAVQIAFVAAAGTLVYTTVARPAASPTANSKETTRRPDPPAPTEPVSLDGAVFKGDRRARVVFVEYADYRCSFCGRFARETMPALEEKYLAPGKVLFAFRHLPLPIHALAQKAAEAAECAGRQGKFWPMHDLLFQDPRQLGDADLREYAAKVALEPNRFAACLAGEARDKVRADSESGRRLEISGTPTFFIGNLQADGRAKLIYRLSGAQPVSTFEKILDRVIAGTGSAGLR